MRIKKEDLDWFATLDISVRFYPESISLDEWIEQKWNKEFESQYQYLQKALEESIKVGHAVVYFTKSILEMTDADMRDLARKHADIMVRGAKAFDCCYGLWYQAETFFIEYAPDKIIRRSCRKNEMITRERILKLIDKDLKTYQGAYGDFVIRLRAFMKKNHLDGDFNIYPTQYGIGVWVFYNSHFEQCVERVSRILNSFGIEYENEFSDARWVYRFKISKKEVNRAKVG